MLQLRISKDIILVCKRERIIRDSKERAREVIESARSESRGIAITIDDPSALQAGFDRVLDALNA